MPLSGFPNAFLYLHNPYLHKLFIMRFIMRFIYCLGILFWVFYFGYFILGILFCPFCNCLGSDYIYTFQMRIVLSCPPHQNTISITNRFSSPIHDFPLLYHIHLHNHHVFCYVLLFPLGAYFRY